MMIFLLANVECTGGGIYVDDSEDTKDSKARRAFLSETDAVCEKKPSPVRDVSKSVVDDGMPRRGPTYVM